MKKIYLWAISSAFALHACAQQNPTIIKYAKLITADDAKKHLSIIASDDFEGRETGKPGAEKAANWLPAPSGKFVLMTRLYWPKPEAVSGAWAMPGVQKVP